MKVIKYQLCTEANHGTEDEPKIKQVFSAITLGWSEGNEKIAKWYKQRLWTKAMVKNAVKKGVLTAEDYAEIVGEAYE